MSNCFCFGPPVDSCPIHGKQGYQLDEESRTMVTDVGELTKKLGVNIETFRQELLKCVQHMKSIQQHTKSIQVKPVASATDTGDN